MKRNLLNLVLTMICLAVVLCSCKVEYASEEFLDIPAGVTFEVDGQKIQFEDAKGKSLEQLLELANVTLYDGDALQMDYTQNVGDRLVIQVVRSGAGDVVSEGSEAGGSDPETPSEKTTTESGDTTTTRETTTRKTTTRKTTIRKTTKRKTTTRKPVATTTRKITTTTPRKTTTTTRKVTTTAKTVVNVQYYYDCDGSGHGVKVITYSDGTQKEVAF